MFKRALSIFLRVAFVLACLYYAFRGQNLEEILKAIKNYDLSTIALLTIYIVLAILGTAALRINFLTQGRAGIWTSFKSYTLSTALNNILPAKLGEVAKAVYLRSKIGIGMSESLTIVFWERFFDLNCLLFMGIIVAILMGLKLILIPLAAVVLVLWGILAVAKFFPDFSGKCINKFPNERMRQFLNNLLLEIKKGTSLRFSIILVCYTALCWLAYAGFTILSLWFLTSFNLGLGQAFTVFFISSMGMALPSSPGALGVYEAAVVFALDIFGIPKESSLPLALVMHAIMWGAPTILGLVILGKSDLKIRSLIKGQTEKDNPPAKIQPVENPASAP